MSSQECEYFGPDIGEISLFQLSMHMFHQACLSATTQSSLQEDSDSTGKRLYAGAHVAVRFLWHYRALFENRSVCELGCGIGALGLTVAKNCPIRCLILTDGNSETVNSITSHNIKHFYSNGWIKTVEVAKKEENWNSEKLSSIVDCSQLSWGSQNDCMNLRTRFNNGDIFDIIIGCELMYYLTDIPALLETVLALTDNMHGIFLHAHLFRKEGQEQELIDLLHDKFGWTTFEVPHLKFIDRKELSDHPEWYRIRPLISGPKKKLDDMFAQEPFRSEWRLFQATPFDDEEGHVEDVFGFILSKNEVM